VESILTEDIEIHIFAHN